MNYKKRIEFITNEFQLIHYKVNKNIISYHANADDEESDEYLINLDNFTETSMETGQIYDLFDEIQVKKRGE